MSEEGRFYGKYRGTVTSNVDPQQMGRLLVTVPDVLGSAPATWAVACTPLAGPIGAGMGVHFIPPMGAGVWVEFEHGDPQYPIWVGCRWGSSSDLPGAASSGLPVSPSIVFQTTGKHEIVMSDVPGPTGGIQLSLATGAKITITQIGITIDNGQGASISLTGPTVNINNGALTVT
jgi:uncharacterized protein involved in type VI secretion and phage assembly